MGAVPAVPARDDLPKQPLRKRADVRAVAAGSPPALGRLAGGGGVPRPPATGPRWAQGHSASRVTARPQTSDLPLAALPAVATPAPSEPWSPPNWVLGVGQLGQGSRPPVLARSTPSASPHPLQPPTGGPEPGGPRDAGRSTHLGARSLGPEPGASADPSPELQSPPPAGSACFIAARGRGLLEPTNRERARARPRAGLQPTPPGYSRSPSAPRLP